MRARLPFHLLFAGCLGRFVAAAAAAILLVLIAAPPVAWAHNVSVAVVVPVGAGDSEADADAVVDGLRLAIDESPDVGHAPGSDAGDHLGGVDVEVIELGQRSGDDAGEAVREAVDAGATLVVVVGEAEAVAAVSRVVPSGSAFTITVLTNGNESGLSIRGAVLDVSPDFDAVANGALSEAFQAAYGHELSLFGAVGFDVGQYLDVLIAETDGALPDVGVLDGVSTTAQARMSFTTIGIGNGSMTTTAESSPGAAPDEDRSRILLAALVISAAAVAGMVARRFHSRRGDPPR